MRDLNKQLIMLLALLLLVAGTAFSQSPQSGRPYQGPDDLAGDIAAEREGFMTGNRVYLYFRNTTELSDWPRVDVSLWPNTFNGTKMLDGIGLLIGARVYVPTGESVPVTNPAEIIERNDLDTLYYLQTSYREEMDTDPTGTVEWGLYPVFGYFNETSEYPAMSNREESWPPAGWPATGSELKWPGDWNGRFGRGIKYADLECFFVANDAQDQEYLGPEDSTKYYPRPGKFIQESSTIQPGMPWGGLGIRVEQRGFQWNNPQSRDAIFWEYNIANISDYDLPEVAFGYWVDNAIGGGNEDDELGFFDREIDMAYSWDIDETGFGGFRTGTMGFAYLESPGIDTDGIDNDGDGLIDEKRDNQATAIVGPTDGISNIDDFLSAYKLTMDDLRDHWDADEDQDWDDGIDANNDGVYDITEFAGDDVGLDGLGPLDLNYPGPDQGECNHRPDFEEGRGCEPDFAVLDVTESDMLGLTAFRLFPVPGHNPPFTNWFRNDQSMWTLIGSDSTIEYLGSITNLTEIFATGVFPLFQGRTERISMSELHSFDPLTSLNSPSHGAPALYAAKRIVQVIYERDYRFAQPPLMPTLRATPGDGFVTLAWDNIADTRTRDPFVGNINDFEGYKIYRATDPKLADAEVITDGFGNPALKRPIYQCDLIDGKEGFTDFGLVNGIGYNLGDESGLSHYFVDNTVINGRTYYYAIVAYDYGAPQIGDGVAPSENQIIIDLDEEESVRSVGPNVQIVRPYQKSAGYMPPQISEVIDMTKFGVGELSVNVLADGSLKYNHTYEVSFGVDTLEQVSEQGFKYQTNSIFVHDITDSSRLVYSETPESYYLSNIINDTLDIYIFNPNLDSISTDIFDGLRVNLKNMVTESEPDFVNTGWVQSNTQPNINVAIGVDAIEYFPWDYDIVFAQPGAYSAKARLSTGMEDEFGERLSGSQLLLRQEFDFYVINRTMGDTLDLAVIDMDGDRTYDKLTDRVIAGHLNNRNRWAGTVLAIDYFLLFEGDPLPDPGDYYRVTFRRPLASADKFQFTVLEPEEPENAVISESMKDIKVVPNPYVATNVLEGARLNPYLNQPRRIMFTHLPAQCTIKIFTVSGYLVDVLEVDKAGMVGSERVVNASDTPTADGTAFWDIRTREGLDVAAGMYIYHVKSHATGDEKIGKFAIIK